MTRVHQDLDLDMLRRIEARCSEFEAERSEKAIEFEKFLQGTSGQERLILIQELIALDADIRRSNGETPKKEDYAKYAEELDATPSELLLQSGVPQSFLRHGLVETPLDDTMPKSERYRFEHRLGRGGIGDVWRVHDHHGQRTLAVKTLQSRLRNNADAVERFRREALLTGSLQHPGIPPIYDHGQLEDGTPFFSMKLVAGKTFHEILKEVPPRDSMDLIQIFSNVTQTIAYAHQCGVIHRDLKPSNIMVGRFGEVQVMDWGLAKRVLGDGDDDSTLPPADSAKQSKGNSERGLKRVANESRDDSDPTPGHPDLTTDGDVIGTPRFMSPEQARGEIDSLTPRSDVFGLGSILFHVLTGRHLFADMRPSDVIEKLRLGDLDQAHSQLDLLQEHRPLAQLCKRCLQPSPEQRPSSADEISQSLANYISGMEERVRLAEVQRASTEARRLSEARRHRWVVGMSAAITIVSVASLVAAAIQWKQTSDARDAAETAKVRAESESIAVGEINGFLNEILSSSLPEKRGYDVTFREVIDDAAPMLDGRFADKPRVEASIRRTLGESYRWLGEFNRSERFLRDALAAYDRIPDADPDEVLKTKDALAGTLRTRDFGEEDMLESERLRREVLAGRRKLHGDDSEETTFAMNNLGVVLLDKEEWDEAEELFTKALTFIERHPECDLDRNAIDLNLADVYRSRDGLRIAEPMYLEVIGREDLHPIDRLNALTHLGEQFYLEKRYDEAIKYLRESMTGREKQFGPDNPYTLSSMRKLARAFEQSGQFEQLDELIQTSLSRHIERYGIASSRTFETHVMKTKALEGLGRSDEAVGYMQNLLATLKKDRGEDHPLVDDARAELERLENEKK